MKDNYKKNVQLRCATCGGDNFNSNEDKSYVKCTLCNREYFGGYNELVEFNQESINASIKELKNDVKEDLKKELSKSFKKAFSK